MGASVDVAAAGKSYARMRSGRRLKLRSALLGLFAFLLFLLFFALGTWQVYRLGWKLDLIERVERQLARAPIPAPGKASWKSLKKEDEYLPVQVAGRYLHERETLVQAMTKLGSGYWLLTPLQTDEFVVMVNRGFVDAQHRDSASRADAQQQGRVTITGLLRNTEPDGRFMADNRPEADRWYSRDIEAIGRLRSLPMQELAPYFIDAEANLHPGRWPVGGLTVVKFRNAHLGYAITWYALALMTLVGAWLGWRHRSGEEPS